MKNKILMIMALVIAGAMICGSAQAGDVTSKYDVTLYGKIKADIAYDDSIVSVAPGNYARWVEDESTKKDDKSMNITAAETRLGLKFTGPSTVDMNTSGIIEVDFFDTTGKENKNAPYMRHAFVKVSWPDAAFDMIAGQTWDIVAPLNPNTLNYSVMWWQGNIQYRRPQISVSKRMDIDEDMDILFQAGLFRAIGDNNTTAVPRDAGVDAAQPRLQGRAAFSMPLLTEAKTTLGISGATGKDEYDLNAAGTEKKTYNVSLFALDLSMPIIEGISLKGEYWSGKNVSEFLGGIGQGVNTTLGKEIAAKGGWIAFAFGPYEGWNFNAGYGFDDPKDGDLNARARAKNTAMFANAMYKLNEAVTLGVEVMDMETTYKGVDRKADNFRVQGSVIYAF